MHTLLKTIFISFLIPVIALFFVDRFNPFEYIKFVNISLDYIYEFGLTAYMTVLGIIIKTMEDFWESKKASVICTFYIVEDNKDINSTPRVVCNETIGFASIGCYIELKGNFKRLKKCKMNLEFPYWLDTQLNASDAVVNHCDNRLVWDLGKILPQTANNQQVAEYKIKIPLIKNDTHDNISVMSIVLTPEMEKIYGVRFKTNGFKVQNGD